MPTKNYSNSSGKGALFLIIGIVAVVVIALVVATTVLRSPEAPEDEIIEVVKGEMPEPVYELVVGDIKFSFIEAKEMGNILRCQERSVVPRTCRPQYDLSTTDKFIKVKITAQNVGRDNIARGSWGIEELIDSEERIFYPPHRDGARHWVPEESECGALLRPGFTPTSCIQIYEVADRSIGLRVGVSGQVDRDKQHFLDLDLYHERYCWDDTDCACGINRYTYDCFAGNKTYVLDPDPSVHPQDLIEECNRFCRINGSGSAVRCVNQECVLY